MAVQSPLCTMPMLQCWAPFFPDYQLIRALTLNFLKNLHFWCLQGGSRPPLNGATNSQPANGLVTGTPVGESPLVGQSMAIGIPQQHLQVGPFVEEHCPW